MSDFEALARSALAWLRPEIDKALSAARAALEEYSEPGADASRLAEVRKRIAEVRGSLQMAQLHGAALLAEEMEQVTRAIEAGQLDDAPAAIEALMRALLQLPDYLERVQQGLPDTANLLLPPINALRAARAASAMGEKTAFFPGFAGVRPSAMTAAAEAEPLPVLAKRLRHRYHLALLGWLRKQRPEQALAQLLSVLDRLQQSARSEPAVQMLWAAAGLVEALADDGLDASVPAHSLLGQVDRQIKRVLDAGDERVLEQEPPQELIRLLLYYVAVSSSHGARVLALNSAFRLSEQLPRGEARAAAEDALHGPNEAALGALAAALREQMEGIKDGLDLYVRTADPRRLDGLSASLRSVGGTFAILGREDLRQQAVEHAARIQAAAAGADAAVAAEGVKAAADWLLEAESVLSGQKPAPQTLEHGGAEPGAVESGGVRLSSSSMFEVKRSLLKEALASLALVKDAYTAYLAQPAEGAGRLADPAAQLRQVAGALAMMEEPRAAELTAAFARYVHDALVQDGVLPDATAQEAAAEAMASIEFYLEAVAEQRPGRDHVLDVADSALDVLGYAPEQEEGPEVAEDVAAAAVDVADAPSSPGADLVEDLSSDLQSLAQDLEHVPAPLDEAEAEVEEVEAAPPPENVEEMQARLAGEAAPEWPAAAPQAEVEDAAGVEEIALMSPAEAAEEVESRLAAEQAAWEAAQQGGAVALAIEREGEAKVEEIALQPAVERPGQPESGGQEHLQESRLAAEQAEWPVAQRPVIEAGQPAAEVIEGMAPDALQALSFGAEEAAGAAAADEGQAPTPAEDLPAAWLALIPENGRRALAAPFSEHIDPEILGIFIEEAAEVLAVINEQFPRWSANLDGREPLTAFRRAFHTLKGSGRMAGAMLVGEFSWSVENLLNRVIDRTVPPGEGLLKLMREAIAMLPALLGQLSGGPAPDTAQVAYLMAQAHALAAGQPPPDPPGAAAAAPPESAQTAALADPAGETGAQDAAPGATGSFTGMHPALKKIYLQEAGVYLDQINTWLRSPEAASEPVPFEISRAVHTLSGSSATVGVDAVAAVCHPLDQLLRLLHGQGAPADGAVRALTGRVCEATALALKRLDEGGDPGVADGALAAEIEARLQIEEAVSGRHVALFHQDQPEALAAGHAAPETGSAQGPEGLAMRPGEFSSSSLPDSSDRSEQGGRASPDSHDVEAHSGAMQRENWGVWAAIPAGAADQAQARQAASPEAEEFSIPARMDAAQDQFPEAAESSPEPPPWEDPSSSHLEEKASGTAPDEGAAAFSGLTELMAEIGSAAAAASSPPPAADSAVHSAACGSTAAGEGLDPELLGIFLEESAEIMERSAETLRRWETERLEGRWMVAFQRDLHTLKGGARMVGVRPVADLSHSVEDVMTAVVDGHTPVSGRLFDLLHLAHDQLHDMIEALRSRREVKPAPGLIAELEALRKAGTAGHTGAPPPELPVNISDSQRSAAWQAEHQPPSVAVRVLESGSAPALPDAVSDTGAHAVSSAWEALRTEPVAAEMGTAPGTAEEPVTSVVERRAGARAEPETMRVRADLVDGLVNLAGEVNIFRARMEQHAGRFKFGLAEFDQTIARLRAQLRRLEMETEAQVQYRFEQQARDERAFDPLEMDRYTQLQQMTRSLMESVGDLVSLQDMLADMNRDTETLLRQQGRVNTEMQDRLLRARMVPFHTLAARLRRVVRQTATELGKQAELRLNGAAEELDRNVLERMTAPLEHMLRNAVAHGIEAPAARLAAGKPEVGTVTINVMREGAEVVLTVADDGGGLDVAAIRAKAVQKGLLRDASAGVPDSDIMRFILEPGFSTADAVTQIAGRGVGMDVVNSEIRQLGGVLDIDSVAGRGTAFTVRLPFTLAITQALLVGLADELYAIPLASITGVTRLPGAQLEARYQKGERDYLYGGETFRIHNLKEWVGLGGVRAAHEQQPALVMVRAGGHRVAFHVDALFGRREVVVKSFGPQLAGIAGLSGGTVLGDGRVALIFDMPALVRMVSGAQATTVRHHVQPIAAAEPGQVTVMVVDDSLTVRRVTSRLLERNGMTVITAKDGVEAVAKLEETVPDILLLDVEMPRMDGFELAAHVRNDPRVRHVPIMMITSRTGDKHRQHAASIGVNRYLGKPYQENDLLHNIRELLAEAGVAMPAASALPALAAAVAAVTAH